MQDAERDRAIERVLRQSQSTAGPETASCIDAETLAAWADAALPKPQAALVEQHVADCARCTALVATLVRTGSNADPIEVGLSEAAQIQIRFESDSIWRKWRLNWLVPLATAATAAALWVAIPRNDQTAAPPANDTAELRSAVESTPPPASTEAEQFAKAPAARREAPTARTDAPSARAEAPPAPAEADQKTADLQASERATVPIPAEAPPSPARSAQASAPTPAPTPAPAPAPTPTPAPAQRTDAASQALGRAANQDARGFLAREAAPQIVVTSPDPATRWRVIGAGQVQRSTTGGAQWEAAAMPESATLTAGVAPSATVCWLVGRTGAIYVTTDGLRFMRVPFPERTDFVSIQAADGRRATVVTIDGRTFRTEDQGITWTQN